jgi:hypothetical protein
MSKFSLELPNPFSGADHDLFDFDPLKLMREASHFQPPGLPRFEPPSLDFSDPFENLPSIKIPRPGDRGFRLPSFLDLPSFAEDGFLKGDFGSPLKLMSNLVSGPGKLSDLGLHGGPEIIGGPIGHLLDPVKNLFNMGDIGSKIGGIFGSVTNFLGPVGGIVGGLFGRGQEGVKGLLSSVASGFSFGGPIGAGIMGLAHITGLDKLAGKALGGIGQAIGGGLKAIGGGIKKLFGF